MIGTHQPLPGQVSIMRAPMPLSTALSKSPTTLKRCKGTETNCYWVDEALMRFIRERDWALLCDYVMLFVSAPMLNRLLTVRTEWSRK